MTVPLSLTGKYQIIVFTGDSHVSGNTTRLTAAMHSAFLQLGVNPRKFLVSVLPGAVGLSLDRKMPTVGVFFGQELSPTLSADDSTRLDCLLEDSHLIIPVVGDLAHFRRRGEINESQRPEQSKN